jgi:hypothetical protein
MAKNGHIAKTKPNPRILTHPGEFDQIQVISSKFNPKKLNIPPASIGRPSGVPSAGPFPTWLTRGGGTWQHPSRQMIP